MGEGQGCMQDEPWRLFNQLQQRRGAAAGGVVLPGNGQAVLVLLVWPGEGQQCLLLVGSAAKGSLGALHGQDYANPLLARSNDSAGIMELAVTSNQLRLDW